MNFIFIASILGFLGVLAGAVGAHVLSTRVEPPLLKTFEMAAYYQILHAVVLVFCGMLRRQFSGALLTASCYFFFLGILLFSGSLFVFVLSQNRFFVHITPLGGICLLLGWLALAGYSIKSPR